MRFSKIVTRYLLIPALLLSMCVLPVAASTHFTSSAGTAEVPYESYTYWEDYGAGQKVAVYNKPSYVTSTAITAESIGVDLFEGLMDIVADEKDYLYILDTNGDVVILNDKYELVKKIDTFTYYGESVTIEASEGTYVVNNGDKLQISAATGIFVKNNTIYIADPKGERVIVSDYDGNVDYLLTRPVSHLIPSDFLYMPQKIAVDSKDYTYVSCDGSYYGALVYSPEMEFLGFYGANTVANSVLDVLSNIITRLFQNDEKRAASMLSLPYQFIDMVVGPDDFIYTATGKTGSKTSSGQVSVMNPGGKNILKKESYNFSDTSYAPYNKIPSQSNVVSIAVDDEGFFYIVDAAYGRAFVYDKECNLVTVFGGALGANAGITQQNGITRVPRTIEVKGTDVLVCDGFKNQIHVYELTEYGALLREAQVMTLKDEFEESLAMWDEVLRQDQNCQLAYRGLAKAYYTLGDNEAAAEYARLGVDRETYSSAFLKIRTAWLEQYFVYLFIGIILLAVGLFVFLHFKKKRGWKLIKRERVAVMFDSVMHPVEAFRLVKEKKMGSVTLAGILLILFYILSAVQDIGKGFAFNYFNSAEYNSLYVLLSTVGLVLLWVVANWLVSVLLGGIGRIKEIFVVTCYSLQPLILSSVISLVLTHVLTPDEFVFVELLQTFFLLYAAFMLIIGIMKVHDFEFGRFLLTTVLTIIGMLIIVFLAFLFIMLAQQVFSWLATLYIEIRYR